MVKLIAAVACLLFSISCNAQSTPKPLVAKKLFEGTWYNKKTDRYLRISFEYDEYVLINDWRGAIETSENIDAYKAFIKVDKLILPKENGEHTAPYCEMIITKNKLLYRCKSVLRTGNKFTENDYFVKVD